MKRILYLLIAAILLTSCAVTSDQHGVQAVDQPEKSVSTTPQAKPEPNIVFQDELLNEPPENPRFVIAQSPISGAAEQMMLDAIKRQLLRLGYIEAQSRDDANVVVWYRYDSKQTGMRHIGQASDVWGDQLATAAVSDADTIKPVSFAVQIISLKESRFPAQVIPIWRGEWSGSLPDRRMMEFSRETLAQVFELYLSEQTQNQIAAFAQARERQVKAAVNTYMKMVMYRIQRNWQKPKHNVKGKKCEVKIVQSAVGEIKSHKLLTCDRDRRFRKSIEKAIKASSPLPLPQEHLFDRSELILIFQG
jgi:hypothetical protein